MASKIAVINGCAKDIVSYRSSNRIKSIDVGAYGVQRNVVLKDDTLSWQVIGDTFGWFNATEIYHGEVDNLIAIAEFNIYEDEHGWLFGDINE
jgi:hypothetical protein